MLHWLPHLQKIESQRTTIPFEPWMSPILVGQTSVSPYLFFSVHPRRQSTSKHYLPSVYIYIYCFSSSCHSQNFTPLKGFYPETIIFSNLQAPPRLLFAAVFFRFFLWVLFVGCRNSWKSTRHPFFGGRNFATKTANTNASFKGKSLKNTLHQVWYPPYKWLRRVCHNHLKNFPKK